MMEHAKNSGNLKFSWSWASRCAGDIALQALPHRSSSTAAEITRLHRGGKSPAGRSKNISWGFEHV